MAILKVPRLDTFTRENLVLEQSEIVFDIDLNIFFGGDGETQGGIELGSKGGVRFYREKITLNSDQVQSGIILLDRLPDSPDSVRLIPQNGIEQDYNEDFEVSGNQLIFKDKGLDGFLEVGETVYIYYTSLPNTIN